jgi:hypothetical protein
MPPNCGTHFVPCKRLFLHASFSYEYKAITVPMYRPGRFNSITAGSRSVISDQVAEQIGNLWNRTRNRRHARNTVIAIISAWLWNYRQIHINRLFLRQSFWNQYSSRAYTHTCTTIISV